MLKKKYWLDIAIFIFLFSFGFFLYYQIKNTLVYKWRWESLWGYFIGWNEEGQSWFLNTLSIGILNTIKIILWAFVLALIIGFLLAMMKNSKKKSIRWLAISYIEFVRTLPSLVFLFLFYFFFSSQIFPFLGISYFTANLTETGESIVTFLFIKPSLLENFISGFISLALLESAYIGEIIWAGIVSIEKNQWESGRSLGMSRLKIIRFIVLPQAIYRISPALTGQMINLIKDSSILSIISIQELSFSANNIIAVSNLRFETWIIVAVIYFCLCSSLVIFSRKLEKKFNTFKH
jgi:polar amino acid transport system permease protein